MPNYQITINKTETCVYTTSINVEAGSEKEAEAIALDLAKKAELEEDFVESPELCQIEYEIDSFETEELLQLSNYTWD